MFILAPQTLDLRDGIALRRDNRSGRVRAGVPSLSPAPLHACEVPNHAKKYKRPEQLPKLWREPSGLAPTQVACTLGLVSDWENLSCGSSGWTRTNNPPVNRFLLIRLFQPATS